MPMHPHAGPSQVGSLMYMSPELVRGHQYNEKVDVFSFGIIMYEVRGPSDPRGSSPWHGFGLSLQYCFALILWHGLSLWYGFGLRRRRGPGVPGFRI